MKVLITGGSGAIGTYVVKELISHDVQTTVLDVCPPRMADNRVDYMECDLMHLDAAVNAIRGFDAVVHLAAIPHPFSDPAERVMTVNMVTTYNALEAVRLNGIPRIIYGCSESSTGFGIHNEELKPLYLPIDEAHPCWPHEVYSFTKRFGEVMVHNYTRAYGIESISLRYCWVWLDRDSEQIRSIVQAGLRGEHDPKSWFGCYVAPHDVAQAIRRAVRYRFTNDGSIPFEAFYICADTTFFSSPTLGVLSIEEACTGRYTSRRSTVALFEYHALLRQTVEIRGAHLPSPQRPDGIVALLIGHNQYDVRPALCITVHWYPSF